ILSHSLHDALPISDRVSSFAMSHIMAQAERAGALFLGWGGKPIRLRPRAWAAPPHPPRLGEPSRFEGFERVVFPPFLETYGAVHVALSVPSPCIPPNIRSSRLRLALENAKGHPSHETQKSRKFAAPRLTPISRLASPPAYLSTESTAPNFRWRRRSHGQRKGPHLG